MKDNDNAQMIGCLVDFLLAVFFLPIVGLWLIGRDNPQTQTAGKLLFITGMVLWLFLYVASRQSV